MNVGTQWLTARSGARRRLRLCRDRIRGPAGGSTGAGASSRQSSPAGILLHSPLDLYTSVLSTIHALGKPPVMAQKDTGTLALVLTGGGARAAYQVGFLRWMARHFPEMNFPILTGVSAGAINAAYLASYDGAQAEAVEHLNELWRGLTVNKVFRIDAPSLLSHVARWGIRLVSGGSPIAPRVRGMVDTAPLAETLTAGFSLFPGMEEIPGVARNLETRQLSALGIVTSNYNTGQSITWIQGRHLAGWQRPERRSRKSRLSLDHVMASAALPFFFPAVNLEGDWHGDGGIRLTAPCAPAIHLGATRILALSTRCHASTNEADERMVQGYPPPLQISGQLLNAIFLDDLSRDSQNLDRVNMLLRDVPHERRRGLRPIQLLVARPSKDLGKMVAAFEPKLPKVFRYLVRSLGSRETSSPDVLSLLTFDPEYLGTLIDLGEADAAVHAEEIEALLNPAVSAAANPR
jgi:NTE family protein